MELINFDICFRLDCSKKIGGGHLARALQIKDNPIFSNLKLLFIIKGEINISNYFNDHKLIIIQEKLDIDEEILIIQNKFKIKLTIIDAVHQYSLKYALDFKKLSIFYKKQSASIAIFDGVGIGSIYDKLNINIDLVIAPYLGGKNYKKYNHISGAKYFLFDHKFLEYKRFSRNIDKEKLLCIVTFGKSDPYFITEFILKSILKQDNKIEYKIICGDMFEQNRIKLLRKLSLEKNNIEILEHQNSLIDLYQEADLCICSTGHTKYESCFFGIITIIISMNDEDEALQKQFDESELALHIGAVNKIVSNDFNYLIDDILSKKINVLNMTNKCLMTFDGLGLERVCKKIFSLIENY